MKGAPKNLESWLKISHSNKVSDDIKKNSSDKYKKFYNHLLTLCYDPIGNMPRCLILSHGDKFKMEKKLPHPTMGTSRGLIVTNFQLRKN